MSMFVIPVRSPGLAHISYIFGHGGKAGVVDPRRDCQIYQDIARAHGAVITHIFETHRNEDICSGGAALARRTGAVCCHGRQLPFGFGQAVQEGDRFRFGSLEAKILETPGHTFESISVVLYDHSAGDAGASTAVAVFTGDCLFIGDVGRTDFFPGQERETASNIYESIHAKLLPLGDQTIVYPAHGAGSVCGASLSEREFSTIGHERRCNSPLQLPDKEAFIRFKMSEIHHKPAYFSKMEAYNLHGNAPDLPTLPQPAPLSAKAFMDRKSAGMQVVDIRSPEAFGGAHVPGSYCFPLDMLSAYCGYFLSYDMEIGLVIDELAQADEAVAQLYRMGYDNVTCFLSGGLPAWETAGFSYETLPAVHVDELVRRIDANEDFTLLDVRAEGEWAKGLLPGATPIYLGDLERKLASLPTDRPVTCFCGSGRRAVIAASLLLRAHVGPVENCLGSMAACMALGCRLEQA